MIRKLKKVKVFAIPFAGGSKYSYRVFKDYLPSHFDWETLELPGRGSRMLEPLLSDIMETATDLFGQIRNRINGEEYIIYGHSMGTVLGYELTKKIISAGLSKPVCLFFTGKGAPCVKEEKKISDLKSQAFWKEIKDLGGLPEEILGNEEMKEFFEPFLKADFKAVEEYKYQALKKPFSIPLFIRTGSDEPLSKEDVREWQRETIYKIDVKQFPGDHFFIFKQPEFLMMQIAESYAKAKAITSRAVEEKVSKFI